MADLIALWNGDVLTVHGKYECATQACCIHNPSEHPLAKAPLKWRADRLLMERVCEHGVGHPDPDDLAHKRRSLPPAIYETEAWGIHGCCGCCGRSE